MGRFALVALACCRSDPGPPPPPPPPRLVVAPDAAVDAAPPATGTDVTVTIEGTPHALRYGIAMAELAELEVLLVADPIDCATRPDGKPPATSYQLWFTMPSGPAGTYYVGHPVGETMTVEALGHSVPLPNAPPSMTVPAQYAMLGPNSGITLESIAGGRVRGSLDGREASMFGTVAVHGRFDIALCDKLAPDPLRADAPTTPARGTRGGKALVPQTIQAIVRAEPATREEALSHQPTAHELQRIVFYADKNVPCPPGRDEVAPNATVLLFVRPIGGTGDYPSHDPQPTLADVGDGEIWPAWVALDGPPSLAPGAVIHGRMWTQSLPAYDKHGTFGGVFDAVVCAP